MNVINSGLSYICMRFFCSKKKHNWVLYIVANSSVVCKVEVVSLIYGLTLVRGYYDVRTWAELPARPMAAQRTDMSLAHAH